MAQAKSVSELYKTVVIDVIEGVREAFIDDGVDEQVLQELKLLWENKLMQSKAVEPPVQDQTVYQRHPAAAAAVAAVAAVQAKQPQPQQQQQPQPQTTQLLTQAATAATHSQQQPINVQGQIFNITPAHQLSSAAQAPTLIPGIHHHLTHLQYLVPHQSGQFVIQTAAGHHQLLQQPPRGLPQGAVITVAAPLPSTSTTAGQAPLPTKSINQQVIQLDGLNDSSSDEEEEEEEDDDEEEQNEEAEEVQGEEEDPLNSDDDISDTDPTEVFDVENVVVCQFDKINRSKNKWKFHLKDGIMNLKGKDYVFQKAHGDAEW